MNVLQQSLDNIAKMEELRRALKELSREVVSVQANLRQVGEEKATAEAANQRLREQMTRDAETIRVWADSARRRADFIIKSNALAETVAGRWYFRFLPAPAKALVAHARQTHLAL